MPNLVFLSLEHWDEIWRRNQFLTRLMQKDFEVIFIGPEIAWWHFSQRKKQNFEKIKLKYLYKLLPESLGPLAVFLNHWAMRQQLKKLACDILWINDHTKYFLVPAIQHQKLIYDITDDWTLVKMPPRKLQKIRRMDSFLCQNAQVIIVCSKNLQQAKKTYKNKVQLIKNGINLNDYKKVAGQNKGKYFLYTGSLHEERLDIPLLLKLAVKYPQEQFWFVGPIFLRPATVKTLQAFANLKLLGAKPYAELPKYMRSAKALLVPHLRSAFVNSLDPIKQYEYMLSNRPVIASKVSGFSDWKNIFNIADNDQEFIHLVGLAGKNKIKVDYSARLKIARENTWEKRYNLVRKLICSKR